MSWMKSYFGTVSCVKTIVEDDSKKKNIPTYFHDCDTTCDWPRFTGVWQVFMKQKGRERERERESKRGGEQV